MWFSLFYIFNLEYNKNTKEVCLFIQEFVFGLPSSSQKKLPHNYYLSVTTDIQGFAGFFTISYCTFCCQTGILILHFFEITIATFVS